MSKRFVVAYWLLLLAPTLFISLALFQLLRQEQRRMAEEVYLASESQARNLVQTIQVTTKGVEAVLTQALLLLPAENLQQQLLGMVRTTDLVDHVFIWSPETGIVYPHLDSRASPQEAAFVKRYEDLFSGQLPWQSASQEISPMGGLDTSEIPRSTGGWIPWFEGSELSLLGWVRPNTSDLIYGTEIDLQALLSWLVIYFPAATPKGVHYLLLDGGDRVLHHTGGEPLPRDQKPDFVLPLTPYLPQWKLAMTVDIPPLTAQSGKGFLILAGLLLAIFVAAVILGGAMLTWQANRNMTYAQQKTTFVANVSHELKTPLTSIRMFAELLKDGRIKDPAKQTNYLQVIVAESQRLTRLVNNVLDFGRLEQGRKQYHLRDLNLSEVLRNAVENQRLRVYKAGMVLEDELPQGDERPVRTDPDAIEQVLLNLIDNAIKYAAGGKELVVGLKTQGTVLKLLVMDRGPGIPSKHRATIFEKFQRLDHSLTTRQPGSGLGLSIARSIMRELGGDVTFEPRLGGGSCFVVSIPFLPDREPGRAQKGAEDE